MLRRTIFECDFSDLRFEMRLKCIIDFFAFNTISNSSEMLGIS